MFSITKEDLKKFEQIGTGKYGRVYRIDSDSVIKVYKDTVVDIVEGAIVNPALRVSKRRIKRIRAKADRVKKTDLASDIVVLDGYFHGYVLPFYDGKTLDESKRLPYEKKREISLSLVENDQELKDNYIYPTDYHTDNIMVVDGKVKIIDLDDPLTHYTMLPNFALSKLSMGRLNETIQDFYGELDTTLYGCYTIHRLQRVRPGYSTSSRWIDDYLKEKEEVMDYLIIDRDTDIDLLKELLRNHRFRVVYALQEINHDETIRVLENLRDNGIELFDFMLEEKPEDFFANFPANNKVLVKKDAYKMN